MQIGRLQLLPYVVRDYWPMSRMPSKVYVKIIFFFTLRIPCPFFVQRLLFL